MHGKDLQKNMLLFFDNFLVEYDILTRCSFKTVLVFEFMATANELLEQSP